MALPKGVKAVWDLEKAYRETTATRERVCINGLWRWQPAGDTPDAVPADSWGYFKVPGCWPGVTSYMQKDCQAVHAHPAWKPRDAHRTKAAWYQREITVPAGWDARRIVLRTGYVNSLATVFVDGAQIGEIRFPWGEIDLSSACRPGRTHVLSIHVLALPLRGVMLSYSDSASAKEVRGRVERRGLCGDVYLDGEPAGPRIRHVKVDTSVRQWQITFGAALEGVNSRARYRLHARVMDGDRTVAEFTSESFRKTNLQEGRIAFTKPWQPAKLWDTHTPENQYDLHLSLLDAKGNVVDAALPERFGFRELWIEGRDFYLNGTRIYLSGVPIDNAQIGAAWANYGAVRESLKRLQSFGINFVYTHNYGCTPGSHLAFEEELKAADDAGMLLSFSQPHFGHYDWDAPGADEANGYARHAAFYAAVAGNHPAVVFYSMSHNACGYVDDMNPEMIDGVHNPRNEWAAQNAFRARRAEAIVKRLDPGRVVYHHHSGNLGSMHTINFYANWTPIQEMSDWFGHWGTEGVKPLFTCEYSTPFLWDWGMYRGWYKGKREYGSAPVPWEFCLAEWNAQFFGAPAYDITKEEKENLRWEAAQFDAGRIWHRWDYPHRLSSKIFDARYPIIAAYISDNWPAFRSWGMSANSPWEHGAYWRSRKGVDRRRRKLPVDWDNLQRPGLSADYVDERYERMDLAFERRDWIATPAADAVCRNNMPLLAYIAGKPDDFTSKGHNFLAGETVEKQLIVINNSRETVTAECRWSLDLPRAATGGTGITLETGQQQRIPVSFALLRNLTPGRYELSATVTFSTGETQTDSFAIDIVAKPKAVRRARRVALFDPMGETARVLASLGIKSRAVGANADLSPYDILVIGKNALTLNGLAPDVSGVRDGLKVIVFEQTGEVLERRFGFRMAEYGMRWLFKRVPDSPLLAGLDDVLLRNWRGDATVLPPRFDLDVTETGHTVRWCDIPVTRAWRCGNRGNAASATIEKPACGDFLPILDGGYAFQYAALMEYREGDGMVMFCQTDVTGRTESDAAAQTLARNLLQYVADWKPSARRGVAYAGGLAGRAHLESAGLTLSAFGAGLSDDEVLVLTPGAGKELAGKATAIRKWLKAGGRALAIGLEAKEANAVLSTKIATRKAEHIATCFEAFGADSPFAGVSPAEVHNRDPRKLPLVKAGARVVGNGVLAEAARANVVFCQLAPWEFDYSRERMNNKRTFRKTSNLLARLLGNMGASGATRLLEHIGSPVAQGETRWLDGLYLDVPEEWDDPYRFFRW